MKEKAKRTSQQNKALHKGFGLIAESLNDAGLDMRAVLKPEIEMPWDGKTVKEYIFRPVMKLMRRKDSTTDLDKIGEIEAIWEVLMRFLMQNHGIDYINFPNDPDKVNMKMRGIEAIQQMHADPSYPEITEDQLADKF
jgi:hypothetical protein